MIDQPEFLQRLGLAPDADERAIRRAYARELKLIDQESDPGNFQTLRESYDAALFWARRGAAVGSLGREFEANGTVEAPDDETSDVLVTDRPEENNEIHIQISPLRASESTSIDHFQGDRRAFDLDLGDTEARVREVFSEFQERCKAIVVEQPSADDLSWQRELRSCLDDARLVNIVARDSFEKQIATLLADGWLPGHEALFVAAIKVFGWNMDRRRILGLGFAGLKLDAAIDQRAMYDMQADGERERQRQLIVRLRDPKPASTRELVRNSATLATLVARFPTWLEVITSAENIMYWRELDSKVPKWRRQMSLAGWRKASPQASGGQRTGINWVWLIIMAIWIGSRLLANNGGSTKPAEQAVNPPAQISVESVKRGNKLLDAGDFDGAITAFSEAIARDPDDSFAFTGRGLALVWAGHGDTAEADFARAEKLNPSNPVVSRGRGLRAVKAGQYSAAIDDFTQSLKLDQHNAFSLYWRAIAFDADHQQEKALADANEVIRLLPSNTGAYFLCAHIFSSRGEKVRAAEQANAVIAANSDNANAYVTAAKIYRLVGSDKDAMATLDRGISVKPTPFLYTFRENFYPKADIADRRRDIMAALSLNPHFPEALYKRASLELDAGKYNDALTAFSSAIAEESRNNDAKAVLLAGRAIAYTKLGDRHNAESDFAAVRETALTSGGLNNVCWYLATRNVELQFALATCDAALVKNANNAAAIDSKAFVLFRMERYREAIAAYDAALRLRPDVPGSLFGRGIAKRRLGDLSGGAVDLKAATTRAPAISKEYADFGVVP